MEAAANPWPRPLSIRGLGRGAGVSSNYIKNVIRSVAELLMTRQAQMLDSLWGMMENSSWRCVAVIRCRMWDETTQRLQQNSSHILVLRTTLRLVLEHKETMTISVQLVPVMFAPCLLHSTASASIQAALAQAPLQLAELAALVPADALILSCDTIDAASSNRVISQREAIAAEDSHRIGHLTMWCNAHQVHLAVGATVLCGLTSTLAALYSGSLLLRMGLWRRVQESLGQMVQQCLKVVQQPPELSWRREAALIVDLCLPYGCSAKTRERFNQLLDLLNGDWLQAGGPFLLHHCQGCCQNRAHTVDKIVSVLKDTIFRLQPTIPVRARWTKTTPCLQVMLMGLAAHNVLVRAILATTSRARSDQTLSVLAELAQQAMDSRCATLTPKAPDADAAAPGVQQLVQQAKGQLDSDDVEYAELRSCRLRRFATFCTRRTALAEVLIFTAVSSVASQLMGYLLRAGAESKSQGPAAPTIPLCHWGPAVQRAQHQLCQMFLPSCALVAVLSRLMPTMSINEWRHVWLLARRQLLVSAADQYFRLLEPLGTWPLKLADIVQEWNPERRQAAIKETLTSSRCCLGSCVAGPCFWTVGQSDTD